MSKTLETPYTPAAVRAARPGWRDPRLWIGVAIVAASVLVGAKFLGDADDSVAVWSVSDDMGAGDTVGDADVVARNIRFVQASDADRYVAADEPLPDDATLTRDIGAGELLPRSAIGTSSETTLKTLTFEFEGAGVPAGLTQGDRVDVYVTSVAKDKAGKVTSVDPVAQTGFDRAGRHRPGDGRRTAWPGPVAVRSRSGSQPTPMPMRWSRSSRRPRPTTSIS